MICIKTQHFKYQRIILLSIGLWPYNRTKLSRLQIIFVFSILIGSIVYQFTALALAEYTPAVFINVLSFSLICITHVIAYNSFLMNIDSMKWLLDELQNICNELKNENEIAIITKYGSTSNRYTFLTILFHMFNSIIIFFTTITLHLLDTILPIDETHIRRIMQNFIPEFFDASDSYMFLILLYFIGVSTIGGIALIGTGTMLIAYLKHACGMFKIASYRIEKAMTANMLKNISFEKEIIICKEIIHALNIHRRAIKFCTISFSSCHVSLFFMIGINVICLSINLYKITETVLIEDDIDQFFMHVALAAGLFLCLFIINYIGQEVIDYKNHIIFTAYNVPWYIAPLHIQRLILFLLQSGGKVFRPTLIGGIFSLSIEFFAALTKTSLSYFTIVYSMQQ